MKRPLETLFALLAFASPAAAAQVTVSDAWFRSLPAHLPAGGYFTASNAGRRDVAIIGAQSPACSSLMLHHSSNTGGMSGMAMVDSVTIPAGGTLSFTPGSYHLMCDNPKLVLGSKAPVTLRLSDGTLVVVGFMVRGADGKKL